MMGWLTHVFLIGRSILFFQRKSLSPDATHNTSCHTDRIKHFEHLLANRLHLYHSWGQFTVVHYQMTKTIIRWLKLVHHDDGDEEDDENMLIISCTLTLCQLPLCAPYIFSHLILATSLWGSYFKHINVQKKKGCTEN
jgi:hypothetical protein